MASNIGWMAWIIGSMASNVGSTGWMESSGGLKREIADIKAELRMHRWVLGFIVALNIGILARLLMM